MAADKKYREFIMSQVVTPEEIEYIDSFCANSTRSDRMYALSTIRQQIKSISKTIIDHRNNGLIRAACADSLQMVLGRHKQVVRGLTPSQQTTPEGTKQIMLNYRIIKNLADEVLSGQKIFVGAHEAIS